MLKIFFFFKWNNQQWHAEDGRAGGRTGTVLLFLQTCCQFAAVGEQVVGCAVGYTKGEKMVVVGKNGARVYDFIVRWNWIKRGQKKMPQNIHNERQEMHSKKFLPCCGQLPPLCVIKSQSSSFIYEVYIIAAVAEARSGSWESVSSADTAFARWLSSRVRVSILGLRQRWRSTPLP